MMNIDRYEPASQSLIHILIAITGSLIVFSMIIHGVFIKDMDPIEKVRRARQMKDNDVTLETIDDVTLADVPAKDQVFCKNNNRS